MLINNARDILSNVVLSVITGPNTLRQAFYPYNGLAAGDTNGASDGVGDLPFDHGLSD
jgi:hypothetical protein